jgi:uncharacterized membrane protein YhaH (DUF805 family)
MLLFQSAFATLKKYADFKGRASRAEFWYFFFFVIIVQVAASFVGLVLGGLGSMAFSSLVLLLLFVPQLAVAVRRLHDVSRSGKELAVPLVMLFALPLVVMFGGILSKIVALGYVGVLMLVFANLLLLFLKKGSRVPNRYGASPTEFSFAR